MVEAGGPATHAGIRYQDHVVALYLGRMLDPRERPRHDQPVEVRIEAPKDVDDFVVRFADGTRRFFQVKLSMEAKGVAWKGFWQALRRQIASDFTPDDRFELILGEPSLLATNLRALGDRQAGSNVDEWKSRLNAAQNRLLLSIRKLFDSDDELVWQVFGLLDVSVWSAHEIERDFVPRWLPPSSVPQLRLFRALSDIAWQGASIRAKFDGVTLYERLRAEAGITIADPANWGIAKYREAIAALATIEVPGTSFRQAPDSRYLWPKCMRYDQGRIADFDDDMPGWRHLSGAAPVDLQNFPNADLKAIVVVAGPGFGKSTLVQALARKAATSGLLPVTVLIPRLAESGLSISEYLTQHINSEFGIHVDWLAAANTGSLVLMLDGLDEVASDRRTLVLERLRVYHANHPGVPWLMTVRDPSALAPPSDAMLVELAPLTDSDLQLYADFYRPGEHHVGSTLLARIAARPELAHMVRIPIFLALMLVLRLENQDLRRSELLDIYLETLFRPEAYKATQVDALDTSTLRRIAERAAFEALETDTIGVGIQQFERCVKQTAPDVRTDDIREALVRRGVLRKAGHVRLAFPFPIVQEYLASTELLEQHIEELGQRLSLIARRPWAQAIQFALERHREPGPLVDAVLTRPDDVFHTGLRLVGRCLSNGMKVTHAQRQVMGERLARVWGATPWPASRLVDGIVVDVFSDPLHPAVRARLGEARLRHHGVGTILSRRRDKTLSIEVLTALIAGDLEYLWHLGDVQDEVDRLGTVAFDLYIARARADPNSKTVSEAISCLIGHLRHDCVDAEVAFKAVTDEALPLEVRLSAFGHSARPLDQATELLVKRALACDGYLPGAAAAQALASPSVDVKTVLKLAGGRNANSSGAKNFLSHIIRNWDKAVRREKISQLLSIKSINSTDRHLTLLYSVNDGDREAFDTLLNELGTMDAHMVAATVAMFGHVLDRSRVQLAVAEILARAWAPEERCQIAGSLVTGLTYRMVMSGLNSGTVEPIPPHPGRTAAVGLMETWLDLEDYSPWSRLTLTLAASSLGMPGAIEQLRPVLDSALATEPSEESAAGSQAGQALEMLCAQGRAPTLTELEHFAVEGSYNFATRAIGVIAKGGTAAHAESLIDLFDRVRKDHRPTLLGALEPLAGRLGLRITMVGGKLVASGA